MFHFTVLEVLDRFDMSVPGVFDSGDISCGNTCKLERRIAVCGTDFEDMFRLFLSCESLQKFRILF